MSAYSAICNDLLFRGINLDEVRIRQVFFSSFLESAKTIYFGLTEENYGVKKDLWDEKGVFLSKFIDFNSAGLYLDILPYLNGVDWQDYDHEKILGSNHVVYGHNLEKHIEGAIDRILVNYNSHPRSGLKEMFVEVCSNAHFDPGAFVSTRDLFVKLNSILLEIHARGSKDAIEQCLNAFKVMLQHREFEAYYYAREMLLHGRPISTVACLFEKLIHPDLNGLAINKMVDKIAPYLSIKVSESIASGDFFNTELPYYYSDLIGQKESAKENKLTTMFRAVFPKKTAYQYTNPDDLSGVTLAYGQSGFGLGTSVLSLISHKISSKRSVILVTQDLKKQLTGLSINYTKYWLNHAIVKRELDTYFVPGFIYRPEEMNHLATRPQVAFMDFSCFAHKFENRNFRKMVNFSNTDIVVIDSSYDVEQMEKVISSCSSSGVNITFLMESNCTLYTGADHYIVNRVNSDFGRTFNEAIGTDIDLRDLESLRPGESFRVTKVDESYQAFRERNYFDNAVLA